MSKKAEMQCWHSCFGAAAGAVLEYYMPLKKEPIPERNCLFNWIIPQAIGNLMMTCFG